MIARKEQSVLSVIKLTGRLGLGTLLLLTGVNLFDRPEAHMEKPTFHLIPTWTKAQGLPPALTQLVEHVPQLITTTHQTLDPGLPIVPGSGSTRQIVTSLPSGGTFPPTGVILEYTFEGDNRADARMLASASAKCMQKELGTWNYLSELLFACYSAAFSNDSRRFEQVALAYRGYTLQPQQSHDIPSPLVRYVVRGGCKERFVIKRINKDAPHEARLLRLLSTKAFEDERNNTAFPVEMIWGDRVTVTPLYHRPCHLLLGPSEVLNSAKQLTEAVAFLHSHRIAHLDINWQNILVARPPSSPRPRYLLTDFEMSAVYPEETPRISIWWKEGRALLPPEGIYDVDPFEFDMWSLGIVLEAVSSGWEVTENYHGLVWPATFTEIRNAMMDVPANRPAALTASNVLRSIDVEEPLLYDGGATVSTMDFRESFAFNPMIIDRRPTPNYSL
ncbi:hypothetical protein FRB99_009026 [Tulasnella sp. 403]|nr:hypothetical protein FRB99_009026 [Tulasnella sp. 403]